MAQLILLISLAIIVWLVIGAVTAGLDQRFGPLLTGAYGGETFVICLWPMAWFVYLILLVGFPVMLLYCWVAGRRPGRMHVK